MSLLIHARFPGCGPCRAEFPRLQAIASAYQHKGLVYLGINTEPDRDPYVMPYIRGNHYSFTPLHAKSKTADEYHVIGEPTNLLIDTNGRIIFRGFYAGSPGDQRRVELMVTSMLAH